MGGTRKRPWAATSKATPSGRPNRTCGFLAIKRAFTGALLPRRRVSRRNRNASLSWTISRPAAVEREFGRLKNEYALTPLRARGLERVSLHPDLVMLARLASALARARAVPLAA